MCCLPPVMLRQPGERRLTDSGSVRVHLPFSLNFSGLLLLAVRIIQALVASDVLDYFYLLMRHQGGRRELSTARAQARDSCSWPCRPTVASHRGRRCCGNFQQPSVARRLTATSRKVALREASWCGGWLAQQRPVREASPHGGPGLRRVGQPVTLIKLCLMKSTMKRSGFGFQTLRFQEPPKSFILE